RTFETQRKQPAVASTDDWSARHNAALAEYTQFNARKALPKFVRPWRFASRSGTRADTPMHRSNSHAIEDLIDASQVILRIENILNLLATQAIRDLAALEHDLLEGPSLFPGSHGQRLDQIVRLFAAQSGIDEPKQKPLAVVQPERALHVAPHILRIDYEAIDDARQSMERVMQNRGSIGDDDALDR